MALRMLSKPATTVVEVESPTAVVEMPLPQKVFVEVAEQSEVEALTVEYIELYKKYDYFEVKAMLKRMEEIKKQLQTVANETMDKDKPAVFTSKAGEVEFSERGKKTEVPDPLGLIQMLLSKFGVDVAASVVDIALTPLRKVLSEFEMKAHTKEEPGSRTLKAVRPL